MKVLIVTPEYPSLEIPYSGVFIKRQVDLLRDQGLDIQVFRFHGDFQLRNYWGAWKELHKKIDQGDYDLIHAQWGYGALPVFPKTNKLIITFRGSDLHGIVGADGEYLIIKSFLSRVISRFMSLHADRCIVVSERLGDLLPNRVKPVIISNGVNLNQFKPLNKINCRRAIGLPETGKIIVFPGNAKNPVKRFNIAEKAVELVKRKHQETNLLPLYNIPHDQVPYYLNSADLLINTSIHEGSPNVIKEAVCCNIPIISNDVGDVATIISGLPGCRIVDPPTPENYAVAINDTLNKDFVEFPVDRIRQLDESISINKIISIYKQVL